MAAVCMQDSHQAAQCLPCPAGTGMASGYATSAVDTETSDGASSPTLDSQAGLGGGALTHSGPAASEASDHADLEDLALAVSLGNYMLLMSVTKHFSFSHQHVFEHVCVRLFVAVNQCSRSHANQPATSAIHF